MLKLRNTYAMSRSFPGKSAHSEHFIRMFINTEGRITVQIKHKLVCSCCLMWPWKRTQKVKIVLKY